MAAPRALPLLRPAPVIGLLALLALVLPVHVGLALWRPGEQLLTVKDVLFEASIWGAAAACALRAALVRAERAAWACFGAGLTVYGAGDLTWMLVVRHLEVQPWPSVADLLWLLSYPAYYAGLVLLVRTRMPRFPLGLWLDGVLAGLAAGALVAAVAFPAIVASTGGDPMGVAVTLAYPVADLLLLMMVVSTVVLAGGRAGAPLGLVGAGALAYAVTDVLYVHATATGSYVEGNLLDLGWPLAASLLAAAAWAAPHDAPLRMRPRTAFVVPALAGLVALGVLVHAGVSAGFTAAPLLAAAAVAAAILRTLLGARDAARLAETRRQVGTDELTGLPNRRGITVELDRRAARGEAHALVLVDLDGFREVNDTLGHEVGDRILRGVGDRLAAVRGPSDMVARLGSDDFAVLLGGAGGEEEAHERARSLHEALGAAVGLDGVPVRLQTTLGVARHPADARSAAELLQRAEVALDAARRAQERLELYTPARDRHAGSRLAMLAELREGIGLGQLELHVQPKVELPTGRLAGVEALVRWRHPERGLLFPDAFLSAVEQTWLMRALTERLLEDAVALLEDWGSRGIDAPLALNVSAPNLMDPDFPATVARHLGGSGVGPAALRLEVTENAVMVDVERASRTLRALRDIGVGLSIDDFGTGHSSLARLKHLPVDELKIDRSFVFGVTSSRQDAAIVHSAVTLGHDLGLTVVAEGVEEADAWHHLVRAGCDRVQGYLVARPLPVEDFEAWLAGWERAPAPWAADAPPRVGRAQLA